MNIQVELISIGDELLNGRTLNTHGRDLGEALAIIGLQLSRDTTIPDNPQTIAEAVSDALKRVNLVFVSGGLGPTPDDVTRDALANLLNRKIILDRPSVEKIQEWFESRDREMTPPATRQALVLSDAEVLYNTEGHAPGQLIQLPSEKLLFVLPGPPNEFNAIVNNEIIPRLKDRYADVRPKIVRIVRTRGIGESNIMARLETAGFKTPEILIGFYPGQGQVEIRLTAEPDQMSEIDAIEQKLRGLLSDHLDPES
ncbi:MAG TPA: molybdopterin-binding protein [Pontiella sp.]